MHGPGCSQQGSPCKASNSGETLLTYLGYSRAWCLHGDGQAQSQGRACVQVWAPGPALTSFPAHPGVPPRWAAGGSHMGPSQYPCWPVFCWELALFSLAPWGPGWRPPRWLFRGLHGWGPQDRQACVVGPEPHGRATLRSCTCWAQDCRESGVTAWRQGPHSDPCPGGTPDPGGSPGPWSPERIWVPLSCARPCGVLGWGGPEPTGYRGRACALHTPGDVPSRPPACLPGPGGRSQGTLVPQPGCWTQFSGPVSPQGGPRRGPAGLSPP